MGTEQVLQHITKAGERGATRWELEQDLGLSKAAVQRTVAQLLVERKVAQSESYKRRGAAVLYAMGVLT